MRPSQMVVAKLGNETDADRSRISDRRGLSPPRLRARLSGDLDAIVSMAMRKEPDRRYPSVEALADDLNRHLQGQPVRARQGDWRYNSSKFLRRGTCCRFWRWAAAFLWPRRHRGRDPMGRTIGPSWRAMPPPRSAIALSKFQRSWWMCFPRPTRSRRKVTRPPPGSCSIAAPRKSAAMPRCNPKFARSFWRASVSPTGARATANARVPLFEQAVAIRRSERPMDSHRTAAALANLARALTDGGNLTSAEGYLQQALDLSKNGDSSPSVETADILVQFAQFELSAKIDQPRATKLFTEALGIYRSALGNQHLSVAVTLSGLASAALWTSDYASAERYERQAIEIFQATVSRNYPDHAVALATAGIHSHAARTVPRGRNSCSRRRIQNRPHGVPERTTTSSRRSICISACSTTGKETRLARSRRYATRSRMESRLHGPRPLLRRLLSSIRLPTCARRPAICRAPKTPPRQSLAVSLHGGLRPGQHLYVASARQTLGEVLLSRGALAAAEVRSLRAAADINTALVGADHWRTARSARELGLGADQERQSRRR